MYVLNGKGTNKWRGTTPLSKWLLEAEENWEVSSRIVAVWQCFKYMQSAPIQFWFPCFSSRGIALALLGKGGELEKQGSECEGCCWALLLSEQMDGSNLVIASGRPNSGDAKRASGLGTHAQ